MPRFRLLIMLLVTNFILVACGGGGHSGSGPSFVGRYIGTANVSLTFPRQVSISFPGSIQFVVSADSTVSVSDPGQPVYATGALTGNTFAITAPGSTLNSPGVSCTGSFTFNGTISGTTMNGTISSTGLSCNGVPVTLTGTFTASLQAQVPARSMGGGLVETLRNAVRSQ